MIREEKNPKNSIIVTTIHPPTTAIKKLAQSKEYNLIVIGDQKTPSTWYCRNTTFLPLEKQNNRLTKKLPINHYSRKMIGYLHAIKIGSEVIIDTDDDNIPLENWGFGSFEGTYRVSDTNLGFVNIYKSFTDQHIWPRGYPLNLITNEKLVIKENEISEKNIRVGIWQGLADRDPDVDAIYRLTNNQPCYFKKLPPIVLNKGTLSPFNSQNTAFTKEVFPLLYLPAFVSFRFTDILRGLVAQPIMWTKGYHLGFLTSTVIQVRNPHNYMDDFSSELPCYMLSAEIIETVMSSISNKESIPNNLFSAYESLYQRKIVTKEELELLLLWLVNF